MSKKHKRQQPDQVGLVSLIVVSVMAVVLALVSVGFSRLMNREVRRSLDNRLNAQAYYSAVAGLNDAKAYINAGGTAFSGCNGWPTSASPVDGRNYFTTDLSGGSNIAKYSCVRVTRPEYIKTSLNDGQSRTFLVDNNTSNLQQLYFDWQNTAPGPFVNLGVASPTWRLPQANNVPAGATGLLEVNIYPVKVDPVTRKSIPATSNTTLDQSSRTYFFYPQQAAAPPYDHKDITDVTQNGSFIHGRCNTIVKNPVSGTIYQFNGSMCNAYLDKLDGQNYIYYVRLTARYANIEVNVQAADSHAQQILGGTGKAQTVVDVTGQGTDVFQRIVEWADNTNNMQTPQYGLQSMVAICKGFRTQVISNPSPNHYLYGTTSFNTDFSFGDGACDHLDGTPGNSQPLPTNTKPVNNIGNPGH